ncbi:hypothetical protein KAI58_00110 [Candidatus Gracilibacteria bacterium]|nr:hypothetical protein [Candidatus Gracilibacteria bacterium]
MTQAQNPDQLKKKIEQVQEYNPTAEKLDALEINFGFAAALKELSREILEVSLNTLPENIKVELTLLSDALGLATVRELLIKIQEKLDNPEVQIKLEIYYAGKYQKTVQTKLLESTYTLDGYKTDIKNFFEGLPDIWRKKETKDKILSSIESLTQQQFKILKLQAVEAQRRGEAGVEVEDIEREADRVTLSREQTSLLNADPKFNISSLVEKARKKTGQKNQMDEFYRLFTDAVYGRVENWLSKNREFVKGKNGNVALTQEKKLAKDVINIKSFETSFGGKGIEKIQGAFSGLVGNFEAFGFTFIGNDPILKKVVNAKLQATLYAALKDGKLDDPKKIKDEIEVKIREILKGTTLNDIEGSFKAFGTDEELEKTDLQFLRNKMQTIKKGYIGSDWDTKYETYVRETGKGSMDFVEWIDVQKAEGKISFFEKFLMDIKSWLPDFVLDFINGEQTEEQKKGPETKYQNLIAEIDNPGGLNDSITVTQEVKQVLKLKLEKEVNKYGGKLSIKEIDGVTDFSFENLNDDQRKGLNKFLVVCENDKFAANLLKKGCRIDDLIYIANYYIDDEGTFEVDRTFEFDKGELEIDFPGLEDGIKIKYNAQDFSIKLKEAIQRLDEQEENAMLFYGREK